MDKEFTEVPEQIILNAIELGRSMNVSVTNFEEVLKIAEEYKKADMTPAYILYTGEQQIQVVAEETFGKKLH